jgi:DNA-binding transcriptional ArsR family regulator
MTLTPRETEILEKVRSGISSPTILAAELGISQSGATQALQKLERKGVLTKMKVGRGVIYRPLEEEPAGPSPELEEDLELIMESYHSLSKVWSHVLRLDLTQDELEMVRGARNMLEDILIRRGKSLD